MKHKDSKDPDGGICGICLMNGDKADKGKEEVFGGG